MLEHDCCQVSRGRHQVTSWRDSSRWAGRVPEDPDFCLKQHKQSRPLGTALAKMVAKKTAPSYPFPMTGPDCSPASAARKQAVTGRQDRKQQSDQHAAAAAQQHALGLTNSPLSGKLGSGKRESRRKTCKQQQSSATYSTGSDARPKQHQLQRSQLHRVPADKSLAGQLGPVAAMPAAFCNSRCGMPLLPPVFIGGMMAMLPVMLARQPPPTPALQQLTTPMQQTQQQKHNRPQPKPSAAVLGLLSNQLKLKQHQERCIDMQAKFAATAAAAAAAAMPGITAVTAATTSTKLMPPATSELGTTVCKKAKATSGEPRPVKVVTCYQDLYDLDEATESSESEDEGDYQPLQPFVMSSSATKPQVLSPAAAAAALAAQRAAAMAAVMTANKAVRAGTPPAMQFRLPVMNDSSNQQVQRQVSSSSSQDGSPKSKKRGSPMRRQQHMVAPQLVPSRFALEAAAMRSSSMHHGIAGLGRSAQYFGAAAAGYGILSAQQYHGYHFQAPQPVNTASLDALAAAAAAASEELDMTAGVSAGGAVSTAAATSSRDTSAVLHDAARSAAEISAELQEAVKLLLSS